MKIERKYFYTLVKDRNGKPVSGLFVSMINGIAIGVSGKNDNVNTKPRGEYTPGIMIRMYCTAKQYERFVNIVERNYPNRCMFDSINIVEEAMEVMAK